MKYEIELTDDEVRRLRKLSGILERKLPAPEPPFHVGDLVCVDSPHLDFKYGIVRQVDADGTVFAHWFGPNRPWSDGKTSHQPHRLTLVARADQLPRPPLFVLDPPPKPINPKPWQKEYDHPYEPSKRVDKYGKDW